MLNRNKSIEPIQRNDSWNYAIQNVTAIVNKGLKLGHLAKLSMQ